MGYAREPIFTPAGLSAIPTTQKKSARHCARSHKLRLMERETSSSFVIRCGTPDCEWGFPMPDLGEIAFEACYSSFRKHCFEVHGLEGDDLADSEVFLDLEVDADAAEVSARIVTYFVP